MRVCHRHVTSIATYTVIDQQSTGMFTGVVTFKFRFHKDTWLGEPLRLVRLWPDLNVELYSIHICV